MWAYWKLLKNQEFVQLNVLGQKAAREWLSPVSLKSKKNLYEIIFRNVRNPCTSNTHEIRMFKNFFYKIQPPKPSGSENFIFLRKIIITLSVYRFMQMKLIWCQIFFLQILVSEIGVIMKVWIITKKFSLSSFKI